MDPAEVVARLKTALNSQFEELGVEGFVMTGYINDGEGHISRFAIMNTTKNAAVQDGLQKIAFVSSIWAQPNQPEIRGSHDGAEVPPGAEPPAGGSCGTQGGV